MKKTTLFTTLALVVIVAIALSTATFAWYTANSSVGTGNATLSAAEASSTNIAISWTQADLGTVTYKGTSIDFAEGTVNPMVPKTDLEIGITTYSVLSGNMNAGSAGTDNKFTAVSESETPWQSYGTKIEDGNTKKDSSKGPGFYIGNMSSKKAQLKIKCEFVTADNNNKLVVAVFVNENLSKVYFNGDSGTKVHYGVPSVGSEISLNESAVTTSAVDTESDLIQLDAFGTSDNIVEIKVVAWFDGVLLGQDSAGKDGIFKLSFSASEVAGD